MHIIGLISLCLLVLSACDNGSDSEPGADYSLQVGDTLITIPAVAVDYAGGKLTPNHFSWDACMLREYQIAANPSYHPSGPVFSGSLNEWKGRPWNERQTFLLEPFTRDVNTNDAAEYYYLIGTFPEQFGYGWTDTFDPEADLWNSSGNPWASPADTTLRADSPGTVAFDGETNYLHAFREMWVLSLR